MRAAWLVVSLFLCCVAGAEQAQAGNDLLIEPETGAQYPAEVTFAGDGVEYCLSATGVAVRNKFWFDIYSIAHYLEAGPRGTQREVLAHIMSDDTAKQVILEFARNLRAEQVRDGLTESFNQHASAGELRATQAQLREFVQAIRKDVMQHDRFVVRWLPGGRLVSIYDGKVVSDISNPTFARVFWSMYFGKASIVDRDRLIALRVLPREAANTPTRRFDTAALE